jgi:hypothetical protein
MKQADFFCLAYCFALKMKIIFSPKRLLTFTEIHGVISVSPLATAATTVLLYQPRVIDNGDRGAIGGM